MDQRIIALYDEFVHGHFDRRLFLDRASKVVGSTAAAAALLTLKSNYALAAMVAETDSRITTERVTFKGASGDVKAYLAKPKKAGKHGGILVVHQNRGLNPHIEDITRRWAAEGYVALGVDFLSPLGGTPKDEDLAMTMFAKLDNDKVTGDAIAAVAYLRARPEVNGKVGAIGFCWGGGVINQLAVNDPTLNAGAVYYGVPPKAEDVAKIKAPLVLNYADPTLDTRLGQLVPAYVKELKADKKKYSFHFYKGANHAFNDDTAGPRYNAAAAKRAWKRSEALFKKYVA